MTPEHRLYNECRLWCGENNYIVLRQQSGIFYDHLGHQIRIGFPGLSDSIILDSEGNCYFAEYKVRPNKPTKEQLEFIDLMRKRGFKAAVIYSLDDLKNLLLLNKD